MWSLKDVEADATAGRTAMAAGQASLCLADISRACPLQDFVPRFEKGATSSAALNSRSLGCLLSAARPRLQSASRWVARAVEDYLEGCSLFT